MVQQDVYKTPEEVYWPARDVNSPVQLLSVSTQLAAEGTASSCSYVTTAITACPREKSGETLTEVVEADEGTGKFVREWRTHHLETTKIRQ